MYGELKAVIDAQVASQTRLGDRLDDLEAKLDWLIENAAKLLALMAELDRKLAGIDVRV